MKFTFPAYPDTDITHIAHNVLLAKWVDDHEHDVFRIKSATIKGDVVTVNTAISSSDKTATAVDKIQNELFTDYVRFVEEQIN